MRRLLLSPLPWLLGLILLLTGCATLQPQLEKPQISLVGIDIRELGLLRQRYVLTLSVQNPNAIAIPVRGMSYALRIAGEEFANGVSPKAFTVPSYGETDVEVEMTTNLLSTLSKVQDLLTGKRDMVDYQLSGKLEVDMPFARAIPFSNRGEFRLTP
ncbi:MAG TPA: LEA type 2 family protein [Gammaproteobacteria bacterium]|nr:LEA type 2 family protein [Gammaproteobacteria bacterium]